MSDLFKDLAIGYLAKIKMFRQNDAFIELIGNEINKKNIDSVVSKGVSFIKQELLSNFSEGEVCRIFLPNAKRAKLLHLSRIDLTKGKNAVLSLDFINNNGSFYGAYPVSLDELKKENYTYIEIEADLSLGVPSKSSTVIKPTRLNKLKLISMTGTLAKEIDKD